MANRIKRRMLPWLFTLGGGLVGYGYYYLVGCASGSCAITASPVHTMLYLAVVGYVLSGCFQKGCGDKCSI